MDDTNSKNVLQRDSIRGACLTNVQQRGKIGHNLNDWVAQEVPIALVYNGISHVVMMASPKNLEDFALGFSLSEGIIKTADEIRGIDIEKSCHGGIELQIELSPRSFAGLKEHRRNMAGRTGCGICGTEQLSEIYRPIPPLPFTQTFSLSNLDNALQQLPSVQEIGSVTGCTHAAAWIDNQGNLQGGCEDVGRHVALDKLIGLRAKADWQQGAILVSSRASYEMVQKSAMSGAEILFAVSAATSLAIETALRCQLTLVGFCKKGRAIVYTHPERLTD